MEEVHGNILPTGKDPLPWRSPQLPSQDARRDMDPPGAVLVEHKAEMRDMDYKDNVETAKHLRKKKKVGQHVELVEEIFVGGTEGMVERVPELLSHGMINSEREGEVNGARKKPTHISILMQSEYRVENLLKTKNCDSTKPPTPNQCRQNNSAAKNNSSHGKCTVDSPVRKTAAKRKSVLTLMRISEQPSSEDRNRSPWLKQM